MNGDPERFLEQVPLRGAPPHLRDRVLARVTRELTAPAQVRWTGWAGVAVAAGLLLGVALNAVVVRVQEARLAALYGPRPVPRPLVELAETVAAVTDEQTASWFQHEWLQAVGPRPTLGRANSWIDYNSQILGKEWWNEEAPQDPQSHPDRRRGVSGAGPDRQRGLGLDHGLTA
jgi:hypothetical protein